MTDADVDKELIKGQELRRQLRIQQIILVAIAITLIVGPAAATWWLARQYPSISTISIDNVRTISPSALCPGEQLVIEYQFHAKGAGVLVRDWTTWKVSPPKTVIFSEDRRFILGGPIDQQLSETWTIPTHYFDYEREELLPMPPGDYIRYQAISSPSNSTVVAIVGVPYTVRGDCL